MDALDHMAEAHSTFKTSGKWVWTDEALDTINDGIDVHAAQLEAALQADVMSAIAEVADRISAHHVLLKEAA